MDNLEKCPCCKSDNQELIRIGDTGDFGTFYKIQCKSCGLSTAEKFASNGNDDPFFYESLRYSWNNRYKEQDIESETYIKKLSFL